MTIRPLALSGPRVAALDVGTNTVLALVASLGPDGLAVHLDEACLPRLGEGVSARGCLAPEATRRTLEAVERLVARCRTAGADAFVGVGTSALRQARDANTFTIPARTLLGDFRVVSGDDEARLTFEGHAGPGLSLASDQLRCVVDIGGGSTEVAIGRAVPNQRMSLELGSVRLHEMHAGLDTAQDVEAVRARIERALDAAGLRDLPPIVALAGTALSVAAFVHARPHAHTADEHGSVLGLGAIRDAASTLAGMPRAVRLAHPSLEPGRADVLPAGALLLASIAARSISASVTVSTGGVRFGLARRALTRAASTPGEAERGRAAERARE